jgi:hypothetical protein
VTGNDAVVPVVPNKPDSTENAQNGITGTINTPVVVPTPPSTSAKENDTGIENPLVPPPGGVESFITPWGVFKGVVVVAVFFAVLWATGGLRAARRLVTLALSGRERGKYRKVNEDDREK